MTKRIHSLIKFSPAFLLLASQFVLIPSASAASPNIVVSEVATEGTTTSHEFIELYNNSSTEDVSLEGWKVQIKSASGSVSRNLSMEGTLKTHTYALLASTANSEVCAAADLPCFSAAMSTAGGHVVVLDNNGNVVDRLGWGTANDPEQTAASVPPAGSSLARKAIFPTILQDTDRNDVDFLESVPTPTGGGLRVQPVDVCPNLDGIQATVPANHELVNGVCQPIQPPTDPQPVNNCSSVIINEILPNPDGDDTNHEYIELYNESDSAVELAGCSLKVGSAQAILSGGLETRQYKTFYGLTLPNAAGGQVELDHGDTIQIVTYPGGLGDNEAYGLIDGSWQAGLVPTPDAANSLPTVEPAAASTISEESEACPPGKFRNPETNRCKNIEAESPLTPCGPGQVRNPETNRCRNATTIAASLTACDPGESRNPETNRCRKVSTASTSLTACQTGYERNPDTNRCRKVAAAKSNIPMADTSKSSKPVSYLVLVVVALVGLGYAVYEYRHSIRNFFLKRKRPA